MILIEHKCIYPYAISNLELNQLEWAFLNLKGHHKKYEMKKVNNDDVY